MELIIMCGVPGAGKTYYTMRRVRDTGAKVLKLYECPVTLDKFISDVLDRISEGFDVILDETNAYASTRKQIVDACHANGIDVICVYMNTPFDVCVARKGIMAIMFQDRFEPPTEAEGFDELIVVQYEE